jgi:hypothetical protein
LNDAYGVTLANFYRPVGTIGIDHDDFVAPAQALQTVADVVFFVKANDDGGNCGFCAVGAALSRHDNQKIGTEQVKFKSTSLCGFAMV